MSTHQDKVDAHHDNIWDEQAPIDIGALISGIGVLLGIAVFALYVASVLWVQMPDNIISNTINDIANFDLVIWLHSLPEWSDYVQ